MMQKEWKVTTLKKLCTKIGSGATPRGGGESYQSHGISLIRSQNILDYNFSKQGLAFINSKQASELSNVTVEEEDVFINITGDSVARVCQIPNDVLPARVNQHVSILRANKKDLIPGFLKYYLLNPVFKRHLLILANSGGTRNALTKGMLEDLEISLPDVQEQKAIAAVLSCLDDKIELLRQQNQTLEEIAQTLFKHWFVDFEFPDENGQPYKSSGGKMVDSELGEIPEAWSEKPFYDIARYINGGAFKSEDFTKDNSGLPVIKIAEIKNGINAQTKYTIKIVDREIIIDNNEMLFSWSGSPETSIDTFIWGQGKGILNQHTFKVVPNNIEGKPWVYCLLKYYKPFFIHLAKQKQTTGLGHITVADLKDNLIANPDKKILKTFREIITPIFNKNCLIIQQVQSLSRLRDTLLPKLMSGEVRVKA